MDPWLLVVELHETHHVIGSDTRVTTDVIYGSLVIWGVRRARAAASACRCAQTQNDENKALFVFPNPILWCDVVVNGCVNGWLGATCLPNCLTAGLSA